MVGGVLTSPTVRTWIGELGFFVAAVCSVPLCKWLVYGPPPLLFDRGGVDANRCRASWNKGGPEADSRPSLFCAM